MQTQKELDRRGLTRYGTKFMKSAGKFRSEGLEQIMLSSLALLRRLYPWLMK